MGSFSMLVGYFLTIFSEIYSYYESPLLYHYLQRLQPFMLWSLILWSFALQLWLLICVDFFKAYLFGKPLTTSRSSRSKGRSRGIKKTISTKQGTASEDTETAAP